MKFVKLLHFPLFFGSFRPPLFCTEKNGAQAVHIALLQSQGSWGVFWPWDPWEDFVHFSIHELEKVKTIYQLIDTFYI